MNCLIGMFAKRIGICVFTFVVCAEATAQTYFADKSTPAKAEEYELVKKEHGIELYETWYKVKPGLEARRLKAIYMLHAPVDSAVALIRNEARATEWNANTKAAGMIIMDDSTWIAYLRYNLPWPMDDQDCVLRYTAAEDPADGSVIVEFKSVKHASFPEVDGVSRIPDVKGKWVLISLPEGIRTEYFITTTPSTSLPRWITDPIIRNNLIDSMRSFRAILEEED